MNKEFHTLVSNIQSQLIILIWKHMQFWQIILEKNSSFCPGEIETICSFFKNQILNNILLH